MLDSLREGIRKVMNRIASSIFFDKKNIDSICLELEHALISADVDVALVYEIIEKIKILASNEKIPSIERRQQLIMLLNNELISILGKEKHELKLGKENRIIFVGLFGCGKTTTIAKLASYLAKRGHKVCMLCLDTHRPAAAEQLKQLGEKINITTFTKQEERDPLKIWDLYKDIVKKYEVVLIDTAGRNAFDETLLKEIRNLNEVIAPTHVIFVLAADIGQAAKQQIKKLQETCKISGIIISRMDGSAKGGGALAACSETNAKVLFIGTGEHIEDIETFDPQGFVSRLLGMGDLKTLIEKLELAKEKKEKKEEKEKEKFTLLDLYENLGSVKKLGPLSKIAQLIPGISSIKFPSELLDVQEEKIKKWKYIIDSMTKEEIENPKTITGSRIARIAAGSGTKTSEVKELLTHYELMASFLKKTKETEEITPEKLARGLGQKQLRKLAKKFRRFF